MDIPDTPNFESYVAAAAQTAFAFDFLIFAATDIEVYVNGDQMTYASPAVGASQFDVAFTPGELGGTITFGAGRTLGDAVIIQRNVPIAREGEFQITGPLNIAALNALFDRHVVFSQDLRQKADGAVRGFPGEDGIVLPALADRAGLFAFFDEATGALVGREVAADVLALAGNDGASKVGSVGSIAGTVGRTVQAKLRDVVSVRDFGAIGDGVTDDTAAFNAAWAALKAAHVQITPNVHYTNLSILVPRGSYRINGSINWTDMEAWDVHIDMRGAVLLVGTGCAGKAVIDATAVRGIHIQGGTIVSNQADASVPTCGLLVGPANTDTCGNSTYRDLKIVGKYSAAPMVNIGQETSSYYSCYFANSFSSSTAYAYIGDAEFSDFTNVTSDYTALRAKGTVVSLTNNFFYSCHFRNYTVGNAIFLRRTSGWVVDKGCYVLAFAQANVVLYCDSNSANHNLTLNGLYESILGTQVDYCVSFMVPDGEAAVMRGFEFSMNEVQSQLGIFRMIDELGGVTTGTLNLAQCDIKVNNNNFAVPLFTNCSTLTMSGQLRYRPTTGFNLYDTKQFHGIVYTANGANISGAPGANIFSFILFDETTYSGQVLAIGKGPNSYVGFQNGAVYPTIRAEGSAADVDLQLQGKGSGKLRFGTRTATADAPVTGYIEIKDAAGTLRKLAVIS